MGRAVVLANFINRNYWLRGAELGVWKGETTFYLLDTCPALNLLAVDEWKAMPYAPKSKETGDAPYTDQRALDSAQQHVRTKGKAYGARLNIMWTDTLSAALLIADRSLDFVFIDADHRTDSVIADYLAWRPKVRGGGGIFGHDANWPSVQRALKHIQPLVVNLEGNLWFKPVDL